MTRPQPGRAAMMPREERIRKAASRLGGSPFALDVLLASLKKVSESPTVERYRKVDVRGPGIFRDRVAPCPGATELLFMVGFEPLHGHLVLQRFDATALRTALDALEATKQATEYREARAHLAAEHARRSAAEEAEE